MLTKALLQVYVECVVLQYIPGGSLYDKNCMFVLL